MGRRDRGTWFLFGRPILAVLAITMIWVCSACGKTKEYDFVVKNETTYQIDQMTIGDMDISLPPYSMKESVRVSKRVPGINFVPPQLSMEIKLYSDSVQHEYKFGRAVDLKELNEKGLNTVRVLLGPNPYQPEDIFIVKVNQ